jgi:allantoate deiminase
MSYGEIAAKRPAKIARASDGAPGGENMPSGATHDASAMADICPIALLFVRCRGGVSHRPDEFAAATDMDAAVQTLVGAVERLAEGRTREADP